MIILLIIVLSAVSVCAALYPIATPSAVFFTIDPDIVYVTNIVSFLKTQQIFYFDHPGTLAIMLQGILLAPVPVYTNIFATSGFLDWSVMNFELLALYMRLVSAAIQFAGTAIFLYAVYKYTRNIFLAVFAFLAVLSFVPFYFSAVSISAESTSFLIGSIWIYLLFDYLKKPTKHLALLLPIFAGLALANRLTSLLIPVLTLVAFTLERNDVKQKLAKLVSTSILIVISFLVGILPVAYKLPDLFNWIIKLVSRTGLHGSGETEIISLNTYTKAIDQLVHLDGLRSFSWLMLLSITCILYLAMSGKGKSLARTVVLIILTVFISVSFLKYPLLHYQSTNYLVLLALFTCLIAKINKAILVSLSILFLVPAHQAASQYYRDVHELTSESVAIEQYALENPPEVARVWDWSRTHDYSLIWAREYSGVFKQDLKNSYPNLYGLHHNLVDVKTNDGREPIFSICWDQLFLQNSTLEPFLDKHRDRKLSIQKIENSKTMTLVISNHCRDL